MLVLHRPYRNQAIAQTIVAILFLIIFNKFQYTIITAKQHLYFIFILMLINNIFLSVFKAIGLLKIVLTFIFEDICLFKMLFIRKYVSSRN